MVSRVVPVRLDEEVLRLIDSLVRLGVFSSRSEALRELVKAGVERYEKLSRIARAADMLFEIERKTGDIPVRLEGELKRLIEERGRFRP